LEKEKIVTWTASFQHLLFDIIYPYNGKSGVGAVILTPNPYFDIVAKTTDDIRDMDISVNNDDDKKTLKVKLPIPQWAIDESISEGPNEEAPLILNDKSRKKGGWNDKSLILPPSDDNEDDNQLLNLISAAEDNYSSDHDDEDDDDDDDDDKHSDILPPSSDVDDADNEESDKPNNLNDIKPKQAPKAYTGFDDVSKENVAKIHGDLIQRFFHENPEDIEGHGEDTALIEAPKPLQPNNANNNNN